MIVFEQIQLSGRKHPTALVIDHILTSFVKFVFISCFKIVKPYNSCSFQRAPEICQHLAMTLH